MSHVCARCSKPKAPDGPKVSVTRLAAPAAAAFVLPSPLTRLVEIARAELAKYCDCR